MGLGGHLLAARSVYHANSAVPGEAQCDLVEGELWRDPPGYWEDIVYPAYIEAHQDLFTDGDVENGKLTGAKVEDLVLLETLNMTMSEAVTQSCSTIMSLLNTTG